MPELPKTPQRFGPPSRGVTASDVERAADSLLRVGERPTIERIREKLGTGSPNTINPLLDARPAAHALRRPVTEVSADDVESWASAERVA